MDLSFSRFEAEPHVIALPPELAVMLVGVAARQAVSPTAQAQARGARPAIVTTWFTPGDGAFNGRVAALLRRWEEHGRETAQAMNPPFTEPL